MKICIVVGTRPEVIKVAPIIKELEARKIHYFLVHSNQHYSEMMDKVFFDELSLPSPKYNLHVGSGTHSNQTGNILIKIEPILENENPDLLLVQGDTNTVMAAALSAHKLGIKVGHVEAGLRSYDRTMPEESNRVMTDHISDYLFAVSDVQKNILLHEGISGSKIHVVGNTIVDSVDQNIEIAQKKSNVLASLGLTEKGYCLFTAHRAANVDKLEDLKVILELIKSIPTKVVWPIHPRTRKKVDEFHLTLPTNLKPIEPVGYLDFLFLQKNAEKIVTDSGGVQEEACILGVPCITIRDNTERPESVQVGANTLVGRNQEKLIQAYKKSYPVWTNPFGKGNTAKLILDVITGVSQNVVIRKEKISVVGLGYMGLPTAMLLSNAGYSVTGIDVNTEKIASLMNGHCYLDEPGIPELFHLAFKKGTFSLSTSVQPADVYIIAVPTPHTDRKCDLNYVLKAVEDVAHVIKDGDMVIIESTIKPNTCNGYVKPILERKAKNIQIVHCPERAIPGNTVHELVYNDRIIGTDQLEAAQRAQDIYRSFVKGSIFTTNLITAESVKLMENTFRDVNIALANEFSMIADELNFDVWRAIEFANKHPRVNILQPGPGVGGHCIAIDPWFLVEDVKESSLISAARTINDNMPLIVIERMYRKMKSKGPFKVAVLGVAYKKNVDDARETPALKIVQALKKDHHKVMIHDPFVRKWHYPLETNLSKVIESADVVILVTDHDEYKDLKINKALVDTRNLIKG